MRVRFAGQVTGVEGYVESAAMGLVAGRMAAAQALGRSVEAPPATTALGALVNHITGGHIAEAVDKSSARSFQPMNVNYGLFPEIAEQDYRGADGKRLKGADRTRAKKREMSLRALRDVEVWLAGQMAAA
jgi:methylenetetrahydrofolate--tRNA-(uracil-5-)-methyltransferase